jgi:hypothetical protein
MKIWKIATRFKPGMSFYISVGNIWSFRLKLEEVYKNIAEGRGTQSSGITPIVNKSLELRSAFFVLDGHHRIMQAIMNNDDQVYVQWNKDFPYLDAGIGNELPYGYMKIIDFLKEKTR